MTVGTEMPINRLASFIIRLHASKTQNLNNFSIKIAFSAVLKNPM
jgi:hypothetical protein